jgi:protein-disulfide isomerase
MKKLLVASAALLMISGCGEKTPDKSVDSAKPVAAPTGTNWIETVSQTEAGGMIMGNPNAPVKLMEFGALSCPHCAKFSRDSGEELKALVAKGTMSYEFRPFLIHPQDVPATLLARCNGPAPFFAISEQMYAAQDDWLGKSSTITEAEQKSWATMTPNQVAGVMADKLGLVEFVQQRGISADKAKACLADPKGVALLTKISEVGQSEFKITGTPTFVINGVTVEDVNEWAGLKPKLIAAGA